MHSLAKEEQDKAALTAHLALIERYARSGNNLSVQNWLENKLVKVLSDVRLQKGQLAKLHQDNSAPPSGRR